MKVEVDFSLDSNTITILYVIEYWVIQKSQATLNYCDGTANSTIPAMYLKKVEYSINARKVEVTKNRGRVKTMSCKMVLLYVS